VEAEEQRLRALALAQQAQQVTEAMPYSIRDSNKLLALRQAALVRQRLYSIQTAMSQAEKAPIATGRWPIQALNTRRSVADSAAYGVAEMDKARRAIEALNKDLALLVVAEVGATCAYIESLLTCAGGAA
jgi:hypothetical protein